MEVTEEVQDVTSYIDSVCIEQTKSTSYNYVICIGKAIEVYRIRMYKEERK
jgi:hypothetical protein